MLDHNVFDSWPEARIFTKCLHLEGPVEDADSKLRLSMKRKQKRWELGMVQTLFFQIRRLASQIYRLCIAV